MKNIAISDAKKIAEKVGLTHVVIYGYNGFNEWICTYGKTTKQCDEAAKAGNWFKKQLGWKKHLSDKPSRVKQIEAENKALREFVEKVVSPVCQFKNGEKCPHLENEEWGCKDCYREEGKNLLSKLGKGGEA